MYEFYSGRRTFDPFLLFLLFVMYFVSLEETMSRDEYIFERHVKLNQSFL